jgi:pimeloyl-ACP methyl ester carboxylesterase
MGGTLQAAPPPPTGIPGTEVAIVEGAGHLTFSEEPARFHGIVATWLAGHG